MGLLEWLNDCFKNVFISKPKPNLTPKFIPIQYDPSQHPLNDLTCKNTEPTVCPVIPSPASEECLYVILPYFNYCFYKRRKELFCQFVERITKNPDICIVIVEAVERGETQQLTASDLPNTLYHLIIETDHRIWLKENLINVAVTYLPPSWKYMAWIDADLTFLNPNWARETISVLSGKGEDPKRRKLDVVQLFETCANLGPDGETFKTEKGFGFMYLTSGKPYTKTHKYGFWHPGFAWACHRRAYEKMGGLIDWGILGSGDHHMALSLIKLANISHPGNIHENYAKRLKAFETRTTGLRLGYVSGQIQHHWHGRLEDRRYRERWDILTQHKYDPDKDIYKTSNGVIQLTISGLRMQPEINEYFIGRQEDRKEA